MIQDGVCFDVKEPKMSESDVHIGFLVVKILTPMRFFRSIKFTEKAKFTRITGAEHLYRVSGYESSDANTFFSFEKV